jgi:phenylacetate-CoA ligase
MMVDLAETNLARRVYFASPVPIQNLLVSIKGAQLHRFRYQEPLHSQMCAELEKSQWWSASEQQELVYRRLQRMLAWAYQQTDYYRELFDRIGFDPGASWSFDDFRRIPLLTRDDIREHGERMVAGSIPRNEIFPVYTSGTTSSPLRLYGQRRHVVADWAHWTRFRSWCGFKVKEPRITFNGRIFVPPHQKQPPFWRYNAAERQLLMSAFHVSADAAGSFIDRINRYRPVHIDGYVASLYTLARFIIESGVTVHSPGSIITYSETLFPHQKAAIESAFGCQVHNQYGHSESVCWAGECPEGGFHINEEFGYLEVIRQDGEPAGDGERGEIVGTGFHCFGMPIIRYATSDLAVASQRTCSCGRGSRLLDSVEGRVLDVIVTPSGRHIPPTALTLLFDKASVLNIKESQVAQVAADQVEVRVVPHAAFRSEHEAGIIADLRRVLGDEMSIRVEVRESIPRTRAGKFRFVVREWREEAE